MKTGNQQPDFVVVLLAGPNAIVLEECDRFGGLRQVNYGLGDEALEAECQEKRDEAGDGQHRQCDEGGIGSAIVPAREGPIPGKSNRSVGHPVQ